ncbi:hypothetical protein M1146_07095, partial [Patescibacteria group bacterium]|nr:hypothetical protein [Patescibacteria group bacterium]
ASLACHQCKKTHPQFFHWGSRQLLDNVVCLSDTHDRFKGVVPAGDILIHSGMYDCARGGGLIFVGDITRQGVLEEYQRFNAWMANLPHKHKASHLINKQSTNSTPGLH